ncbi:MAG: radical SAM protein, partial [Rikenellaceae bacterium]|nr:radical SAM protein [Rikenellaceae bacterium]
MAGIYIHIPFCKRKCIYCDFYSTAQFEKYSASYLDAVIRELHFTKDYLGADPVNTLYFGGGTPSLYSPAGIGKMIEAVKNIYGTEGITEITLEANPEDITPEYLSGSQEAGINRLSIGI